MGARGSGREGVGACVRVWAVTEEPREGRAFSEAAFVRAKVSQGLAKVSCSPWTLPIQCKKAISARTAAAAPCYAWPTAVSERGDM